MSSVLLMYDGKHTFKLFHLFVLQCIYSVHQCYPLFNYCTFVEVQKQNAFAIQWVKFHIILYQSEMYDVCKSCES